MGDPSNEPLDPAELERLLRATDPAVRLVPSRVLRRVIKQDRDLPGLGLQVPHRKSYVVGSAACRRMVQPKELGSPQAEPLPDPVILLGQPNPERLRSQPRQAVLMKYWRLLFHAAIHRALEERWRQQPLAETELRVRLRAISPTGPEEIRTVLVQERFLLPTCTERELYTEFAAVYLELRCFAPHLLSSYFPALESRTGVERILAADVNADELFQHCRPQGAADPTVLSLYAVPVPAPAARANGVGDSGLTNAVSEPARQGLLARARHAAARGNLVRALISRVRAERLLDDDPARPLSPAVKADLVRLIERLRHALHLREIDAERWQRALPSLFDLASRGLWPVEARLLYDLQRARLDEEQDVYALDVVEWALSLGRRPIKRLLPHEGLVLQAKHLRGAAHRLNAARIEDGPREELTALLETALHRCEQRVRETLRPRLAAVFDEVGLRPENVPEQVARAKLVEELLDRTVARGHLNMGDLRDALSRNDLKLPDLTGPGQLVFGDALLLANRKLAIALDGIYHRGEIYLRWLQRLSAVMFGTPLGRCLMLFLILPFAGAFVAIVGVEHPLHWIVKTAGGGSVHLLPTFKQILPPPLPTDSEIAGMGSPLAAVHNLDAQANAPAALEETLLRVGALGLFLFLLINSATFRRGVATVLRRIGHALHWIFVGFPGRVRALPLVRYVADSSAVRLLVRYVLRPGLPALITAGVLLVAGDNTIESFAFAGLVFLGTFLLLNSRLGRQFEEAFTDALVRLWRRFHLDLIPGLFRAILAFFSRVLEWVERVLYTVDEWLRFRAGDNRFGLVFKTVLGFFWFWVMYVVRFSVNLLIEPQINPIKHFPVVTVSHKLVLVFFVPPFASFLVFTRNMPHENALALATAIGTAIPGLFGFLAWELRENWRLYRANRLAALSPVRVGHHGETVIRLLRPGIHSGTVPKLQAKLRKALRRSNGVGFRSNRRELHHIASSVRHFLERDFLWLLEKSRAWAGLSLQLGEPQLSNNRIRTELRCAAVSGPPLVLDLEQCSGWLVASITEPGWLLKATPEAQRVFRAALLGLYKKSGVELIAEQIEAFLGSHRGDWQLTELTLTVSSSDGSEVQASYDLGEEPVLLPRRATGERSTLLPELQPEQVLFQRTPLPWTEWVEYWQREQAREEKTEILEGIRVIGGN